MVSACSDMIASVKNWSLCTGVPCTKIKNTLSEGPPDYLGPVAKFRCSAGLGRLGGSTGHRILWEKSQNKVYSMGQCPFMINIPAKYAKSNTNVIM